MNWLKKAFPPIALAILILILLEAVSRLGLVAAYLMPAPTEIFKSLLQDMQEYLQALMQTLRSALLGLTCSIAIGVLGALILSSHKWVERAVYPYAIFFQTVPIIAVAPILVIWFGYGAPTVVASSFIVSVFPILANSIAGLQRVDPRLGDLFRLYRASPWTTLIRLRLPQSLPYVFAGVRIAVGLALIGAVVGEFIAGGGIGGLVDVSRTQQRLDKVFSSVVLISIAGILVIEIVDFVIMKFFKKWNTV